MLTVITISQSVQKRHYTIQAKWTGNRRQSSRVCVRSMCSGTSISTIWHLLFTVCIQVSIRRTTMSFKGWVLATVHITVVVVQFGSWTYTEDLLSLDLLDSNVRFETEIDEKGDVHNVSIVDDGIGTHLFCCNDCYLRSVWLLSISRVGYHVASCKTQRQNVSELLSTKWRIYRYNGKYWMIVDFLLIVVFSCITTQTTILHSQFSVSVCWH